MNRKGFTLVELLAVIVILGVVMTIGSVSVTAIRRKIDKNMFETKLEYIVAAGKQWGNDNKSIVKDAGTAGKDVTVDDLINAGALNTEEMEAKDETFACQKQKDGLCYVIVNNLDGNIVNGLRLKVYMKFDRVYACIYKDEWNYSLLFEDGTQYTGLNYYCE